MLHRGRKARTGVAGAARARSGVCASALCVPPHSVFTNLIHGTLTAARGGFNGVSQHTIFSPVSSPLPGLKAGCLAFPGSVDRGYREAVTERCATQARRVGSVPPQLSEKTKHEKNRDRTDARKREVEGGRARRERRRVREAPVRPLFSRPSKSERRSEECSSVRLSWPVSRQP